MTDVVAGTVMASELADRRLHSNSGHLQAQSMRSYDCPGDLSPLPGVAVPGRFPFARDTEMFDGTSNRWHRR